MTKSATIAWHGLWCPNCEHHAVTIGPPGRRHVNDGYSAKCDCGYSVDHLGEGKTLQHAIKEWRDLCQAALTVKEQLLGATAMKEAQQLELNVTAFLGLTEWFDAAKIRPPEPGWYNVRFKMGEAEREERKPILQRRWWSSAARTFSYPVNVGEDFSEAELLHCKEHRASAPTETFEWQGLASQHPDLVLRRR